MSTRQGFSFGNYNSKKICYYFLQHVKTNVIENIVPIVIALKRKLEEMKSPLIDDLMSYLREIMKDYKSEVKEILSADKQLAAEIQFDLKKWEEEQLELMIINRRQEEQRVIIIDGFITHLGMSILPYS